MTPSPVYPCLQVQVLIPAATLVQTANFEHPPLDRLHKSSSERQKEKDEESVITLKDRFNDTVCVCVFAFAVGSVSFISSRAHADGSCSLWPCYAAAAEKQTAQYVFHIFTEAESCD